jgi:predicted RecB family nuclease
MQKKNDRILYSATDLVGFLECEHLTSLELLNLEHPLPKAPEDEQVVLIQQKGHEHERSYVDQLRAKTNSFVDLSQRHATLGERIGFTIEAMRAGVEIIYQGALASGDFIGYPDFLRRVERPSALGGHSYEVVDSKFSRSEKAKFIVQLAFYSQCVTEIQGAAPLMMHVVLGDFSEVHYRFNEYQGTSPRFSDASKSAFEIHRAKRIPTHAITVSCAGGPIFARSGALQMTICVRWRASPERRRRNSSRLESLR